MARKLKEGQALKTSGVSPTIKIDAIYRNGDEGAIREITNLLANALCNRNEGSLAALTNFLGSPILTREPATKTEFGVVQQAKLFINGENAHRVEVWINGYEHSEPDSNRRLLYEDMLHDFVSRQQNLQEMKRHLREARQLLKDTQSECAQLCAQLMALPVNCTNAIARFSRVG
jgi:hypothetical protein